VFVLARDVRILIELLVRVLCADWFIANVLPNNVDWEINRDPPLVEKLLSELPALVLKELRADAVGITKYPIMLESIWPVMEERIVLVWELVFRMNRSEYPIIVELKRPVREDVPVLRRVDTRVDVNISVIGTTVLTVERYTVLKK